MQALKLPYRVIELCYRRFGFGGSQMLRFRGMAPFCWEIPRDFQLLQLCRFSGAAGKIRFKEAGKKGTQFVHTLNGSGLAVGRARMAAILENYQRPDGT